MRLCSINSTMGSSPCPFLARNVANSCSLKFPCLRIVWYCFFTAVLPSRFRNPILRNQAGPPLNFQLWLGHPPMNIRSGYLLHVDVDPAHHVFLESHQPATLLCTLDSTLCCQLERFRFGEVLHGWCF